MKKIIFLFLVLTGVGGHAEAHLGCLIEPKDLPVAGTRAVKLAYDEKRSLDNSLTVQADTEINFSSENANLVETAATWEGFYRPNEDGFYSVLPLPLLAFELTRDRNVIYVCAHFDPDPTKQHFTVYLMKGNHIDKLNLGNFLGDMVSPPRLVVQGLTPVLVPLTTLRSQTPHGLAGLITIPLKLFTFPLVAYEQAQNMLSTIFGAVSGIAVERIILRPDSLELASGVDLEHPDQARWKQKIDFKHQAQQRIQQQRDDESQGRFSIETEGR